MLDARLVSSRAMLPQVVQARATQHHVNQPNMRPKAETKEAPFFIQYDRLFALLRRTLNAAGGLGRHRKPYEPQNAALTQRSGLNQLPIYPRETYHPFRFIPPGQWCPLSLQCSILQGLPDNPLAALLPIHSCLCF